MSASIIIGRNAIRQYLQSDQPIEKLFIKDRQKPNADLMQLIQTAKNKRIHMQWLPPNRFDQRFSGDHQGIACLIHGFNQQTIQDVLTKMPPIVLMLDHIKDPHNFGAICRSAEAFEIGRAHV